MQQQYWQGAESINFQQQQRVVADLKNQLKRIREMLKQQLTEADDAASKFSTEIGLPNNASSEQTENDQGELEVFSELIENISVNCTNEMVKLTENVFTESVNAIRESPPCAFCVVAFGSLAKGEATPYSDLEYLFLLERKDKEIEQYFEKLAVTSYFFIGSLCETKLHYMNLKELKGWFDDKQQSGFKIDGLGEWAGNIPTGNGSTNEKNHFIVTVEELLKRYQKKLNEPDKGTDKADMTAMLQYMKLVFSHGENANELLTDFLAKKERLKTNTARDDANRRMFEADAKKYSFKPDQALIGKGYTVNSKLELYRYPSILLYNISILSKFIAGDSWNTLRGLRNNGIISQSLYRSLYFLLACACYFRLSAYLYHDSQDDRLSVLPTSSLVSTIASSTNSEISAAGRRWYLPQGLFIEHCEHSIITKNHIWQCPRQIKEHLKTELPPPSWLMKFQVFYCCNRWPDGLKFFRTKVNEAALDVDYQSQGVVQLLSENAGNDLQDVWSTVRALSYCLFQYRKWSVAFDYNTVMQHMLDQSPNTNVAVENSYKSNELLLAEVLEEIGNCYNNLLDSRKSIEFFTKSLEIRMKHLDPNHELIAMSHYAIGDRHKALRHFDDAEKHALQALQISYVNASRVVMYDYYGDPIPADEKLEPIVDLTTLQPIERLQYLNHASVMVSRITWNLGRTYFVSKRYRFAHEYWRKTIDIMVEMYGEKAFHRELGSISLNYAMSCDSLGDYREADVHFRKAFAVYTRVCTSTDDGLFTKLIQADRQSSADASTSYYEIAINTFLSLPGFKILNSQTAAVLQYYSFHLVHMKQHNLAEKWLKKCLEIHKEELRQVGKDHSQEARAFIKNVLALNCWKTGRIDEAKELYSEALQMRTDLTESVRLHAAEIRQNIGIMYNHLEDYATAKTYFSESLEIFQNTCKSENHPKIVESKSQLMDAEDKIREAEAD